MPVRPRPEDIALYNEWARRAGRPLWGQPAAKAKARPRVGVRRPVPQPATHGGVQGGADGGFIRGTYVRNATIYARRTDGAEVAIAHFMQRLNRWTVTEAGRDYYRHNRQQFIVNVPAIAYVYRASLGMYIRCTINHVPGGPPLRTMVPIQDEDITTAPDHDGDPTNARQLVLRQAQEYLRGRPQILTEDGMLHRLEIESEVTWFWDESQEMTFDEKIVRHIYHNRAIDFETIMDRCTAAWASVRWPRRRARTTACWSRCSS